MKWFLQLIVINSLAALICRLSGRHACLVCGILLLLLVELIARVRPLRSVPAAEDAMPVPDIIRYTGTAPGSDYAGGEGGSLTARNDELVPITDKEAVAYDDTRIVWSYVIRQRRPGPDSNQVLTWKQPDHRADLAGFTKNKRIGPADSNLMP